MNHASLNKILLLLAALLAACSKDTPGEPPQGPDAPRPTMGITISLAGPTRSPENGAYDAGFELGEGLENYLDIARGNYRIYFFDATTNTYIATFKPFVRPTQTGTEDINGVATYYYWQFLGEVPVDLPLHFKLVVLANWPQYPEEATVATAGGYQLVKGATTITDICSHSSAQFGHIIASGGKWLDHSRGALIPFYGVREYDLNKYVDPAKDISDGKLKGDIYVDLSKDKNKNATALPLLRAMAKVEVILNNPFASFESVTIDRVNNRGFCAPEKATAHTDYDHGYTWDIDFIRGVHLPGGANSYAAETPLQLTKVSGGFADDGTFSPEKWIAYIPEYRNIDSNDSEGYCSIKITLANPDPDNILDPEAGPIDETDQRPIWDREEQSRIIYFATNGKKEANGNNVQAERNADGSFTEGRFNIERNNIYRFTIKDMSAGLECEVDIQPYANCPLVADFGLMRDERGDLMVIPNEKGELPDFFIDYMNKYPEEWPVDEVHTPHDRITLLKGDYYVLVRISDNATVNGRKYDVWVKDKDGCRVMSNLSQKADTEDCTTRLVIQFIGANGHPYNKDKHGDMRLQHNHDHSSIVFDSMGHMLYKDAENTWRYLVESWDSETGLFWYEKSRTYSEDKKTITFVFTEMNVDGNPTGNEETVVEDAEYWLSQEEKSKESGESVFY